MNPSKALGPDELHPRVLKELASELGPVFAHLFQQSIDSGEIPKEWSLANICPLFKKADRSLACNYHPVSLTCIPCKLLEHIVCSNIMSHLDHHNLLSDRQHAFRKSHSFETQLATVIDDLAKILDNQGQVDTFILDFEKAFDTPTATVNNLGWRTLEFRRADARLVLFFKIVHGLVAVPLPDYIHPPNRISRHCHSMTFQQLQTTQNYYKYSFLPLAIVQ